MKIINNNEGEKSDIKIIRISIHGSCLLLLLSYIQNIALLILGVVYWTRETDLPTRAHIFSSNLPARDC